MVGAGTDWKQPQLVKWSHDGCTDGPLEPMQAQNRALYPDSSTHFQRKNYKDNFAHSAPGRLDPQRELFLFS